MYKKYSKPSGDIAREGKDIQAQELTLQQTITEVTKLLVNYPVRKKCMLCRSELSSDEAFLHRDVTFYHCNICGHIQTKNEPDESYDLAAHKALGYEGIYPKMDEAAYASRCERVYKPKADWLFEVLQQSQGRVPHDLNWLEIGCGTGNFLKVLQENNCEKIKGLDRDAHNLGIAQSVLGNHKVEKSDLSFAECLNTYDADIYVAFFVLEHVHDMPEVIKALKGKPKGTLFAFSVPVFGFITLFESILMDHYPRSLDGMMHTQIYTEKSLEFMLDASGYEMLGQWIFGQDMMDVQRFLNVNLTGRYPDKLRDLAMKKISELIDPMQAQIDKAHFSDARHILAVKR